MVTKLDAVGLTAALALALAAGAAAAQTAPLQVSYPGDAALDCAGLTSELAKVDAAMAASNQQMSSAGGQAKGAGIAGAVAVEGMLRTGMLGRVGPFGGLVNMAANGAKQRAAAKQQDAAEQIRVAETRRALLTGMSAGKSCGAATIVPAPQALPTANTAPGSVYIPTLPPEATRHY